MQLLKLFAQSNSATDLSMASSKTSQQNLVVVVVVVVVVVAVAAVDTDAADH